MAAAVLTIDINARLASLEQAVSGLPGKFGKATKDIEQQLEKVGHGFKSIAIGAAAAFGIPLGAHELISVLGEIKQKTIDSERTFRQLDAVLKSTAGSAGLTKEALEDINRGLQEKTVFDESDIRKAQTALLQFGAIDKEVFQQALSLSADLAARMGTDLPDAAAKIRKALVDPERGLRVLKAAGVELSEKNIDLARSFTEAGDRAQANALILDLLAKSVGGAAEGDSAGLYGASKRLARAWDDLQKAFGKKIFEDQGETIGKLTGFYEKLIERLATTRIKFADLFDITRTFEIQKGLIKDFTSSLSPDFETPSKRLIRGKITGAPGEEDLKAAEAAKTALLKQQEDQQYLDQKAALRRAAESAAVYYGGAFAALKAHLEAMSAALDFSYQQNEISSADYYAQKRQQVIDDFNVQHDYLLKQEAAKEALLQFKPEIPREEALKVQAELIALGNQSQAAAAQRDKKLEDINRNQVAGVRKVIDEYEALNVQLLEVTGNTVAAANAAFNLAHRDQARQIAADLTSTDAAERVRAERARDDLVALGEHVNAQAELNAAVKEYTLTLDEVGIAERNIASLRESGALTELETLRAISDARAGKIAKLREELAVLEEIALKSGKREDIIHLEEMKAKLNELVATGDLVAKKFNEIGASALSDALQSLANGEKSFKQAAIDFGKTLTANLNKVFADDLTQKLFSKDGPLGGFGDFFSSLLGKSSGSATGAAALTSAGSSLSAAAVALTNAAASLQGASFSSSAGSSGGGFFDFLGKLFGGGGGSPASAAQYGGDAYASFAVGTDYVPRDMFALVHKGERITPAQFNTPQTRRGGRVINLTQIINVPRGTSGPSADQIALLAGANAQRATARNG